MSRITVVIPVWDAYCTKLPGCVADVLCQDERVEVIVVDNASEAPLPRLPDRVRTMRLPGRVSVGAARNAALPEVATPYVLFADADDRLLPGTLAFLGDALDADPGLAAAVARQLHWDPSTGERAEIDGAPRPVVYRIARFRRLLALCTLRFNIFPIVGCAALRTDAVRAAGGFGDGNLGEDWELCSALAWRGRIAFFRRPGRLYAVEDGSLWHRAHERDAFERQFTEFRERLFADPSVPGWARLLRPAVTRLQRGDLDRMFAEGAYHPRPGRGTGAGMAGQPVR